MNESLPAAAPAAPSGRPLAATCLRAASRAGFTLIELLVVIGILSILMVVLLPHIMAGREAACIIADQANLRWHYQTMENYRQRLKRLPKEGGHKFVLAPWVEGTISPDNKTPENRDRYFTPGLSDTRLDELRDVEPKTIWKTFGELSSLDTAYAGRAKDKLGGRLESGSEAWIGNDNEFGPAFAGGSINVLVGDGNVRELNITMLKKDGEYPEDPPEGYVYKVGRDSPHRLLQTLDL